MADKRLIDTRILLVEDEEICRHTVCVVLENQGASVAVAENAEDAVGMIRSNDFELIISDVRLPGMDGIALLETIRKINANLPVIIMTGYSSIGSAVDALKLGAQDYLVKPLGEGSELINSVWKAVEHYRLILNNASLQAQLMESEETFRMLFHNASDAIFLNRLDDQGNICSFSEANNLACDHLGYTRQELSAMTLLDITAPEHRDETLLITKTLPDIKHVTYETIHLTKKGERIPVEINAHLFSLKGCEAVLSIVRNIAARRKLEKQITEISEKESRRIGQELHDVLCQDLVSVKMLTSVLKTTLEQESSKGVKDAEIILDMASNALTSTRRLCAGLLPLELENGDLGTALEHLAINNRQLFRIPCTLTNKLVSNIPDKSAALHLYRIAQQAANNAAVHGDARNISITLSENSRGGVLTVQDDGIGINHNHRQQRKGMGLQIMKYRARMIGAVLTISKIKTGGTKVECLWQ